MNGWRRFPGVVTEGDSGKDYFGNRPLFMNFENHHENENYSQKKKNHECYTFRLTDLRSLWVESLNGEELEERNEQLNLGLEAPCGKLGDYILKILTRVDDEKSCSVVSECKLITKSVQGKEKKVIILIIHGEICQFPIEWTFKLESLSSSSCSSDYDDFARDLFIVPFGKMAHHFYRENCLLRGIIQEKDKELEKIRKKGVRIPGVNQTEIFSPVDFAKRMDEELSSYYRHHYNPWKMFDCEEMNNLYTALMRKERERGKERDEEADRDEEEKHHNKRVKTL
eukprot:Nk52_evm27s1524 gene=Nk52_evmTU27s1524